MKFFKRALLVTISVLFIAQNAIASFVLNGTRYIYDGDKKSISIDVTNPSDKTLGGQVWVDNFMEENDNVFMVPTPSFFKLEPNQKQIIRIMKVNDNLPRDRESIFWLNVQEIPLKPQNTEENILSIAMNTQVKLIYRPKLIANGRKNAEQLITVTDINGKSHLKNPTPYYFAVIAIKEDGKEIKVPKEKYNKLLRFSPNSEISIGKKINGKITIDAVDDFGGIQTYALN